MTEYQDTVEWLYNQLPMFSVVGPGAYKPGLQTSHALDDAFGNPHRQFKTIHVGGTNGKGSVSHSIASVLMAAGYKVGLYTSPHLVDFRERIRINGEMMPQYKVVDFVNRYRAMDLGLSPSFFELTTIMAFDYFASQNVDFAVIEVGLGGRLDTTNIINPILSVITNVSLDHVALLGNTIEAIAKEKAGIIKPNVPVVIGEAQPSVRKIYEEEAIKQNAPIVFAEDTPISNECVDGRFLYWIPGDNAPFFSDLRGACQPKNANTVIHALRMFDWISDEAIKEGLSNVQARTGLKGRWMQIGKSPLTVCDTGHNIGAWEYLALQLCSYSEKTTVRVVLGFADDKDVEAIFKLLPKAATYYLCAPSVKRARSVESLMDFAQANGLNAHKYKSVAQAYAQAKDDASADDFIFVGGSNFVVSEIL